MARSPGRREGRLRVGSLSRMFAFRTFAVRSARQHMLRNTALSRAWAVRGTVFRPAGGCGCCRSRGHGAGWSVQTPGAGRRRLRPGPGARPIGRRGLTCGRGCSWQWLPRCAHHALPSPGLRARRWPPLRPEPPVPRGCCHSVWREYVRGGLSSLRSAAVLIPETPGDAPHLTKYGSEAQGRGPGHSG